MSNNKFVLEIQGLVSGRTFKAEIISFQFPSSPVSMIGGHSRGASEQKLLTAVTVSRAVDEHSSLFINQMGKLMPKIMLKSGYSRGKDNFLSRRIFTLTRSVLDSYSISGTYQVEKVEDLYFSFDEISYTEESTLDVLKKAGFH